MQRNTRSSFVLINCLAGVILFGIPAPAQPFSPPEVEKPIENAAEWHYSKEENPLYGKSFDRFTLTGKFLKPPSVIESEPKLIIGCSNGKFGIGELSMGVKATYSGTKSLKGQPQAQLDMRIDEKKKTEEWLEFSNDRKTLFFDKIEFIQLLTGRLLGHPGDNSTLAHRLVLGLVEQDANEVIVQFDMPRDETHIVNACGLEWGKKKKK
jgi:hypothetical protein